MIPKALERATTSWKIFIFTALLFCVGVAGGTTALFTAETTQKTSTFGGGWVGSPTNAAAAGPNGADMTVTWTTPTTTGVQGYAVLGTNMGTAAVACPAASTNYPVTITTLAAPASSYVATNAANQADDGFYYCYQVRSYWTTFSWWGNANANAQASATRIGLYPTGGSISNGSTSNTIDKKDSFQLNFNQNVTASAPTVFVCGNNQTNKNIVIVGGSSCSATPSIGTLKLSGATIANGTHGYSASISGSGSSSLTVKLPTSDNTSFAITGTASWTFVPSASLSSAASGATAQAPLCTSAQCTVGISNSF